ncbi:SagB/ThcOx family dehydrogenase [Mobilitalea sibirica]|uniref:SagB/ThcOx family dehydrogenase n=1 Tax=Mobilitalea sibirica TaxID=1462919 RepID=A0A8J7KWR6_9FIRM|nr:SagB/ThcOx family dehydrogenase [Mobilitalea sibirica]MBH1940812.1 SagB/ThcOx family dehydrogenase [Mobilitalea sibirica]
MEDDRIKLRIMELREMMKAVSNEGVISDQMEGKPQPPMDKICQGTKIIPLSRNFEGVIKKNDFLHLLNTRTSKRRYSEEGLTLEELSFLLWATQGVKAVVGKQRKATMRTVPSAGARHPFETYLFINRVEGLEPGIYHYLAMEHKLEYLKKLDNQADRVSEAYCGQTFFGNAPASFVWTVLPYRSEWRYTTDAHKYALLDAGHVCQNLYLASEAIDCGTCAIGAYDQALADALLDLDTNPSYEAENEFVVYAASVGKVFSD